MNKSLWPVVTTMSLFTILLISCTVSPSPEPSPPQNQESGQEGALIEDRTGRVWDVTHAREVYGMTPDYFNYGLGVGAITSVDEPTILNQGDPGYPEPDSQVEVFGVLRNGEARGYNVSALTRHEVFNDVYPTGGSDRHVAVTY